MKINGNTAPVTSSGDISQATLLAGPMDIRTLYNAVVKATIAGASASGTLQLYGVVGNPSAASTAPNGLSWPTTATDLIPIGSPVTFTGAGITAWDVGSTRMSALYVGWTKTGTSSGTLAVTWNA
jgi:hypothetical protein